MTTWKRCIARALMVCTLMAGMPLPVNAGIVSTSEVAATAEHDRVKSFLERAEVRAQLEALGVSASDAHARVDALTPDEAKALAFRIDELPAGAGVVGALVFVFLVLLVTDILGLTKVFPFTRSVR